MRRMQRRIVALLAAAGMVSLAACGTNGGTSGGNTGDAQGADGDLSGVTLTILMHPALVAAIGGEEEGGLIHEFEEQTGADVVVVTAGIGEHIEKAMADFAAGTGTFDIINMQNSDLNELTSPYLLDLSSYIDGADPEWDYEDFPQSIRDFSMTDDGQTIGIPFRFGVNVLYFRQDLLDEAGLDVPTTFDEYREVAATLGEKFPDITPVYQRGKAEEIVHDWLGFFYGAGGDMLDASGKCAVNSGAGVAAAELFAGLYADGSLPEDFSAVGRDEYIGAMQQGRAAMGVYLSQYWLNLVGDDSSVGDDMAWGLQPTLPGVEAGRSRSGGWYLSVPQDSKNADAAWAFIEFVTSPENALRSALEWGNGPVRTSTYQDEQYSEMFPLAQDWLVALEASTTDPAISQITQIIDTLSPILGQVTAGEVEPQAGLDSACEAIDGLLGN